MWPCHEQPLTLPLPLLPPPLLPPLPLPLLLLLLLLLSGASHTLSNINPGGWVQGCKWNMFYGMDTCQVSNQTGRGARWWRGALCVGGRVFAGVGAAGEGGRGEWV
jgi:hypothetical protein